MRIGELAKLTGCQSETVRFYEQKGLLPPPVRSQANYRVYDASHAERLHFIWRCRALGMSLAEIETLLGYQDAPERSCTGRPSAIGNRPPDRGASAAAHCPVGGARPMRLRSHSRPVRHPA
jgi:DNA-binding transcriptional MerR regulator